MQLKTFDSPADLDQYAAQLFAAALKENPESTLGLATGSTPIGIYEKMIMLYEKGEISFKSATTFNLDEYVGLSPDHEQSYARFMSRHLFSHIDLPAANAHLPKGTVTDLEAECAEYDRMLEERPVDIQLLGLGHNGHIGFNEPDDELQGGTHIVELEPETREANARFFDSIDEVPTRAITMGVGSILKAESILLVVKGADKAEIVKQALRGPITTECPASLLQTHKNVTVLVDREAGRLL
ncbi:glucosamine-6-phosphate deaminase [Paenibacillus sacheonensis]|uniref:Glucosamine-6-phosphate deaminase n=1 Tax=Paenibacillus sacheonensis TaxID=742054 RepID=A0A7X4YNI3_9BACL|nr:glucosamine-6-phosphate deaminase [Paenibacillus sacheonensis]MBM7565435.1 glucosamine-6-phosphate deaminase [Paenibacillus sacheonensis]NBC69637.1 glucosamine-6-phosphate deaminase [Paenibacillus sacheonensis]